LSDSALLNQVNLNTASFHSPSALFINLHLENLKNIHTLIDSGSTDCFINSQFAINNNLPLVNLKNPLWLTLFDGSVTTQGLIIQSTTIDI